MSTCRFAQRVALVRNEALLNEEKDPQQEISLLRADVRRLKQQIALLTAPAGTQVRAVRGGQEAPAPVFRVSCRRKR